MKLKILAFIAIAVMSVSSPANAAFYTGGDLLSYCEGESVGEVSDCYSYLAGIVVAHDGILRDLPESAQLFCMPIGATLGQLRKAYCKYSNEKPQLLHYDAAGMVIRAFAKAFPCE